MTKPYDPRSAIRRATRSMDTYVQKHSRPLSLVSESEPTSVTTDTPELCVVLLSALLDGNRSIVPDDFHGITTSDGLRAHVRPDGAVYLGAFELQNTKDSLCLVYGPKDTPRRTTERAATVERPALMHRHQTAALGVFAAPPPSTPPISA